VIWRRYRGEKGKDALRDFSIVIPTYGRPDSLEQLLRSLTGLEYPSDRFEVIVVDDGGSLPLEPRFTAYRDHMNLNLLWQRNAGPGAARNHGALQAQGKYLAFTDDDCVADPGWLRAHAAALGNSEHAICGGRTLNRLEENIFSEATQLLADYIYEHYNPTRTFGAFFPTNNLSVSREAFLEIGGFDGSLRFGEDRDLCYRWAARGHAFLDAPEAVVRHAHALTFLSFLRLHHCYGEGTHRFRKGCIKKGFPRLQISPALWYVNLVLSGVKERRGLRGLILSMALAVTQAVSFSGMIRGLLPPGDRDPRPGGEGPDRSASK
jgi:glycosyltransferase involved in cell wall biosynthesis